MKRILWMAALLTGLVTTRAGAQTTVNETHPAPARGIVSVRNVSGFVHVTGWSRKEVQVKGTLGPRVERLDFEQDEDRTRIEVELPEHIHSHISTDGKDIEANL